MDSPEIVLDMTTTRTEFFRNLKVALRDMDSSIDGNYIKATSDDIEVTLKISPIAPLVLGPSLELECWKVTIEIDENSEEQREAFMKTFWRAFHRGGG